MSESERQLVVALWKQTDELLSRTRRQIDALTAKERETNERAFERGGGSGEVLGDEDGSRDSHRRF